MTWHPSLAVDPLIIESMRITGDCHCRAKVVLSLLPFCCDRDVHVIDVGRGASGDGDSISNVYVNLAAADAEANESRDVALVLHSAHPVRWIVSSSSQLAGSLVILVTTKLIFPSAIQLLMVI